MDNLEFAYPLAFLLLPLPILVYRLVPAYRHRQSAIKVPFFNLMMQLMEEEPHKGVSTLQMGRLQRLVIILTWCLAVLALAKPIVLGEPQTREMLGRDIMVIVDISGSMNEEDFAAPDGKLSTRWAAAQGVLKEFAKKREGDRLGLILFGDAAYLQTPFTADHSVWQELLDETEVGMAGPSTHLGDAIGLAIKVFDRSDAKEKVVILLTDGNDTDSYVPPIDASKVARAKDVRIHVIAMGDPETTGEQAMDMTIINGIAKTTGGKAFEALSTEELDQAYAAIDELEPKLFESVTFRPKTSLHYLPIMAVLVMYILFFALLTIRYRLQQAKRGVSHV